MLKGIGSINNLYTIQKNLETVFKKLASGKEINSFADDPAGGVISTKLEALYKGIDTEISNLQTNLSISQTKESGYSTISDALQKIRENVITANSSSTSSSEKAVLQKNIDNTLNAINETIKNTKWSDKQLLDVGDNLKDILENGIDINDSDAVEKIDTTINEVLEQRSAVGSDIESQTASIREKMITFENTMASYSQIGDSDMAKQFSSLIGEEIKQNASISTLKNLWNLNLSNILKIFNGE